MEAIETELIKDGGRRDERGRRIVGAEERTRLLAAYESSGLTQKEYARREGIKFATFTGWLMRQRRHGRQGPAAAVSFRELVVGASAPAASLEVRLPDGLIVRGHRASEVAELIRALRA